MTALKGAAQRPTVIVAESDNVGHHPLHTEIVHPAHPAGPVGASVFRGLEGSNASSRVHPTRVLSLVADVPVSVIIIDPADRIWAFFPVLEEIVVDELVLTNDVGLIDHAGRPMG